MSDPFDVDPQTDLSALDAPASAPVSFGSDQDAIKAINRRTSMGTKVMTVVILLGLAGGTAYAIQRNTAYEARMDVLNACGEIGTEDPQLNVCLRNALETAEFDDTKQRILRNLGHRRDEAAVPLITRYLDQPGVVRRHAAEALANIGLPAASSALPRLAAVLSETDERDRNQVVWSLAVLHTTDQAAIDAIVDSFSNGQLQSIDGFEPRVITDVLGVARLSTVALTNHDSEPVRRLTAHALAEDGSSAVIEPLARMLQNEIARETGDGADARSVEVIRASAAGLGRTGEASAAQPLFAALASEPGLEATIVDALEKSTSAADIAMLLPQATAVEVKRAIVMLLSRTHDPASADALITVLTDPDLDVRSVAALALAELGNPAARDALYELTTLEDNDDLVSDAIEALRNVVDASDVPRLTDMIESHPYRRAAILRALGATGSPDAVRPIEAELEGDDMRSAALSLGDLNADGGFRTLLGWVIRPDRADMAASNAADRSLVNEELLGQRRAAIMAMGRFGRIDAVESLMVVVEDDLDDYELRGLAAAAIGQVADAPTLATVIEKATASTLSDAAKRYYVQALWQRPHRELNAQLLSVLSGTAEPEVKRSAALALGYAADPANDARLMAMLDDESLRRNAAFAILLGGGEEAVSKLIVTLDADADLREVLQMFVTNTENDWFNLLTVNMFESGAVWNRLRAAAQLRDGIDGHGYAYPWSKIVSVLRSGWEGAGGLRSNTIREHLWTAMSGEDAERRYLAGQVFADIPELAFLLKARDAGGEAEVEARRLLSRGH